MARGGHFQTRARELRRKTSRRILLSLEDLESRRLLTASLSITQFPLVAASEPQNVTVGSDGNLYCTDSKANSIDELNVTTHAISVYPIPGPSSGPTAITSVPKGNIYFIEPSLNAIGSLNLTTHVFTQIPVPTPKSQLAGITTGPDLNIYFTEQAAGKIGELNLTTNVITETLVPGTNPEPTGIAALGTTAAPAIYVTLSGTDMIDSLSPASFTEPALPLPKVPVGETIYTPSATYTSTSPPAAQMFLAPNFITEFSQLPFQPVSITAGSDGNLYFTEFGKNAIGALFPAGEPAPTSFPTNETITDPTTGVTYSAASPPAAGYMFGKGSYAQFTLESTASLPDQVTGFDNSVYFTDTGTNEIGELTTATGINSESPVPSNATLSGGLAYAPDGNLYFTATEAGGVGEIGEMPLTTSPISVFEVAPNVAPVGIASAEATSGTDLYFTEFSTDQIGELSTTPGSSITNFSIPTPVSGPEGIAVGSDGNVYFTESAAGKIGELNTTTDQFTEFLIPPLNSGVASASVAPLEITNGPSGSNSLYFTESGTNEIGEISTQSTTVQAPEAVPGNQTITTPGGTTYAPGSTISSGTQLPSGTITQFVIPTQNSEPVGIAVGADDNIYFTESGTDKIGELATQSTTISTLTIVPAGKEITTSEWMAYPSGSAIAAGSTLPAGTISEFNIPSFNGPALIAPGPGGNIWFTLAAGGVLAYLNPETGIITDPAYPAQGFVIAGLTSGPAPNYDLFLTDDVHNQIGEVSSIGQPIITFGPGTGSSTPLDQPDGITTDANGNLWFTEYAGNEIGEAQVSTTASTPTSLYLFSSATVSYSGESVTYTAVVTPTGSSTATGDVTFFVDGQQQVPAALIPVGGTLESKASISIVVVNPGPQTITAVYNGDFSNEPSSMSIVLPNDGPTVVSVQRFGVHKQPTTLVLTFSEPLGSGATNPANFELTTPLGLPVGIKQASFNSTGGRYTVTLVLAKRLNVHRRYVLTVIGTGPGGVTGTSGVLLDGAGNGVPGSNYVTSITAGDLVQSKAMESELRRDRAKSGRSKR